MNSAYDDQVGLAIYFIVHQYTSKWPGKYRIAWCMMRRPIFNIKQKHNAYAANTPQQESIPVHDNPYAKSQTTLIYLLAPRHWENVTTNGQITIATSKDIMAGPITSCRLLAQAHVKDGWLFMIYNIVTRTAVIFIYTILCFSQLCQNLDKLYQLLRPSYVVESRRCQMCRLYRHWRKIFLKKNPVHRTIQDCIKFRKGFEMFQEVHVEW